MCVRAVSVCTRVCVVSLCACLCVSIISLCVDVCCVSLCVCMWSCCEFLCVSACVWPCGCVCCWLRSQSSDALEPSLPEFGAGALEKKQPWGSGSADLLMAPGAPEPEPWKPGASCRLCPGCGFQDTGWAPRLHANPPCLGLCEILHHTIEVLDVWARRHHQVVSPRKSQRSAFWVDPGGQSTEGDLPVVTA